MPSGGNTFETIGDLLLARIELSHAQRRRFAPGLGIAPSVVSTYRLILVTAGRLDYALEDESRSLNAGTLLLVPAWMKRGWRAGSGPAEIIWAEFSPAGEATLPSQIIAAPSNDTTGDEETLTRIVRLWSVADDSPARRLALEGEVKTLLGRLALYAERSGATAPAPSESSAAASAVAREAITVAHWLEKNFAQADPVAGAMKHVASSPAYFRTQFKARTGFTLPAYLEMVRMRRARYLLATGPLPVKEVSGQIGFRDPLHFSRRYRAFWGHAPMEERRGR